MKNKRTNTKQTVSQNRKKIRMIKRRIVFGCVCLCVAGMIGFFWTPTGKSVLTKGNEFLNLVKEKAHLELEQVHVEGRVRTQLDDINKAVSVTQGMPIFEINLIELKENILQLPWVQNVLIERHLPNQILIRLTEKTPIAIWQHKKEYWPIDETGQKIADNKTVLSNVLLVVGEDAPEHTPSLMAELKKYPNIAKNVISAVRVGNRRWNLHLNDVDGLVVYLPETEIGKALERLQEFDERGQILDRNLNIIDLKLPDRLIVRSQEEEITTKQQKKKK